MKNKGFLSPVRMNLQQEFCTQNISAYHQFNKDPKEYVFVGEYVGKRFVTCLETYRHIVSVNNEEDISEFLDIFIKFKEEHSLQWINVTKEMDNYLIWCDWKSDIVLGKYWFQVEKINDYNLSPKIPIELLIKILRPVLTREEASQEILQNFLHDTIEAINFENTLKGLHFIAILALTTFTFFISASKYLLDYSIKLLYALAAISKAIAPVACTFFHCTTKCILGLYQLIYMIFKNQPEQPKQWILQRYPRNNMVVYQNANYRAIEYRK